MSNKPQDLAVDRLNLLGWEAAISSENTVDYWLFCLVIYGKGDATGGINQRERECKPVSLKLRDEIGHDVLLGLFKSRRIWK